MLGSNKVQLVFDDFEGVNRDILGLSQGDCNANFDFSSSFLSSLDLLVEERCHVKRHQGPLHIKL